MVNLKETRISKNASRIVLRDPMGKWDSGCRKSWYEWTSRGSRDQVCSCCCNLFYQYEHLFFGDVLRLMSSNLNQFSFTKSIEARTVDNVKNQCSDQVNYVLD